MPLPFLKPKKSGSVVSVVAVKDGKSESQGEENEPNPKMLEIGEKLISAIHAKDAHEVAESLTQLHQHMNPKVGEQDEN